MGEEYRSLSSSLCSFLHSVTSSLVKWKHLEQHSQVIHCLLTVNLTVFFSRYYVMSNSGTTGDREMETHGMTQSWSNLGQGSRICLKNVSKAGSWVTATVGWTEIWMRDHQNEKKTFGYIRQLLWHNWVTIVGLPVPPIRRGTPSCGIRTQTVCVRVPFLKMFRNPKFM